MESNCLYTLKYGLLVITVNPTYEDHLVGSWAGRPAQTDLPTIWEDTSVHISAIF